MRNAILGQLATWPGVRVDGSVVAYAGRELGTVGDGDVTLRYPRPVRAMLVETGRVAAGPGDAVTYALGDPGEALELFRLAYERARVAERVRAARRR